MRGETRSHAEIKPNPKAADFRGKNNFAQIRDWLGEMAIGNLASFH